MNSAIRRLIGSSLFFWIGLAIVGFFYLFTFDGYRLKMRQDRVRFGIDLVGGTYITLEVETDKAVEADLHDKLQSISKRLQDAGMEEPEAILVEGNKGTIRFESDEQAQSAYAAISKEESKVLETSVEGDTISASFNEKAIEKIREFAVQGNIEVLRTRLDTLGVGEIPIAAQGENHIIVEMPDVKDPAQAKAMIGKPALLEIKLVEKVGRSPEDILDEYDGELPEGMIIIPGKEEGYTKLYYLVPAFTDLTGRLLKNAWTGFGGELGSEIVVNFEFKPEGGEKFYELTSRNPNRQIAVIVDGVVISAPRAAKPIGATGYIYGQFTPDAAKELATLLKSGAFIAPVKFVEERQIGPSLGQEAIRKGILACLVGLALLFVFSLVVYKTAGLFAFIALLFNLLLILIALGMIHATLTLPGIAGMVLTIGMAIDASILIYEKIREEVREGVQMRKAVQDGFSEAMEVILDSNITTFIVGAVLYKFGVGPIQGFAMTLMIGIIATLITGLFFLRSIFTFLLENVGVKKIKI